MMYKIILTATAFSDLEGVKNYISLDNPSVAEQYIEKILIKLDNLGSFPRLGKAIANSFFNYAKCFYLPCMNHIAIYQINENTKCVYIVRVLSHFQDWKNIVNKDIIKNLNVLATDDRIKIVQINTSMIYDIWANSLDDDNRRFVPDEVFESLEETYDVVNNLIESYQSEDGPFVYAIIRNNDNANIGYVQLVKIDEGWEIGYHIAKLYTNNGYATEAVNLFLDYLKNNTDLEEIYGVALAANKASRRVLEKCGFELIFEGQGLYQGNQRKIIKTIKKL